MQRSVTPSQLKIACSNCYLRELCLPAGFSIEKMQQLETLSRAKRACARGDYLFRSSNPLHSLYAIHSGSFKTQFSHENAT